MSVKVNVFPLCFRAKHFSTSWAWETMGCSPEACWERTRKVRRAILPHSSPHALLPKRENVFLEGNNGEHSRERNRRNGRRISELWAIKSLFEDQFLVLMKGMSSVIALNIKFSARSHRWWKLFQWPFTSKSTEEWWSPWVPLIAERLLCSRSHYESRPASDILLHFLQLQRAKSDSMKPSREMCAKLWEADFNLSWAVNPSQEERV